MVELVCRRYGPQDREAWDTFVASSKNGTFLLARGYMDYHSDRFIDASSIITDGNGKIIALFPANCHADVLSSHGGLTYGGMVCGAGMTGGLSLDVFSVWLSHWQSEGVRLLNYKCIPAIYHRMPADEELYALFYHGAALVRRDMLQTVDLGEQGPVQERRARGAKKAAKAGLQVRETQDIDAFWEVLDTNLRLHHDRRPVHTAAELRLLKSRFPDEIRLFGVYEGEALCAGSLLYCSDRTIHAQYIASSEEVRKLGGLDILFLTLLDEFRGRARYFDFGTSNENDGRYLNRGLAEFKEGFGARAIVQDFYRLDLASWRAPEGDA